MIRKLLACAGIAALVSSLSVVSGSAQNRGKRFDAIAQDAVEVTTPQAIASLFWSQTAACDGFKNDFERRQCIGLRSGRQVQLADQVFLVDGDAGALIAAPWDPASKTIKVEVAACVACEQPIPIEGQPRYLVGSQGAPAVVGAALLGPTIRSVKVKLPEQAKAEKWRADVLPRLRTQLLFRVPPTQQTWTQGDASGMTVNIAGYRVYDRCTGKILVANPPADRLPADKSFCKEEPAAKPVETKPTGPVLPDRLTPIDIKTALQPATLAAQKCYEIYGVAGNARFKIVIDSAGAVTQLEQRGDFLDTPTGRCIEKEVRKATFPKSKKRATTVDYPFVLR